MFVGRGVFVGFGVGVFVGLGVLADFTVGEASGTGTISYLPAVFGCYLASAVIRKIVGE